MFAARPGVDLWQLAKLQSEAHLATKQTSFPVVMTLRWLVLFAATTVVTLNAAAGFFELSHPNWAIRLNPFNTNARFNSLTSSVSQRDALSGRLSRLRRDAYWITYLSPSFAKGHTLLGEIHLLAGDHEKAGRQFVKALSLHKTEITALRHRLKSTVRSGEFDETVERLDAYLRRRWRYPEIKPVILALAEDHEGGNLLRQRLGSHPPWRGYVLHVILSAEFGLKWVKELLIEERARGKPVSAAAAAAVVDRLLKKGHYSEAYETFLLTLSPEESGATGTIFNSRFRLPADKRAFNWRVSSDSGAELTLPYRTDGDSAGGLAIRFRGTPIKDKLVVQALLLPAGSYTLSQIVTTQDLEAPNGLFWEIQCSGARKPLGVFSIGEESYRSLKLSDNFIVPRKGCPLQNIWLRAGTAKGGESAPYTGGVIFHEVTVAESR